MRPECPTGTMTMLEPTGPVLPSVTILLFYQYTPYTVIRTSPKTTLRGSAHTPKEECRESCRRPNPSRGSETSPSTAALRSGGQGGLVSDSQGDPSGFYKGFTIFLVLLRI